MSKRILVIDDEPDVNITLRKVLEKNGFIVDSYENPFLALDNFKPHYYDLLILAIKMPGMNGFTFYRQIKELDDEIKVCILTAAEINYGEYSDILSSLPDNYIIQKPVTNEELLKTINRVMFCV